MVGCLSSRDLKVRLPLDTIQQESPRDYSVSIHMSSFISLQLYCNICHLIFLIIYNILSQRLQYGIGHSKLIPGTILTAT